MSRFNLEEALAGKAPIFGNVPDSGTREQIEYIDLSLIDSDPNNFYELSGIDELASNILLCGLQQPIRVRDGEGDRVVIVSGHRRKAALEYLTEEGHVKFNKAPCIRETSEGSPALQELRLIYANSDTRRMSSADLSRQAERVEALLYQLKEEGYEFPGRMRDHVAQACKVSKTKLSNLKVIRENLCPQWKKAWESGKVAESVALAIAKLPEQHQKKCWEVAKQKNKLEWYYESEARKDGERLENISILKCPEGGTCQHVDQKFSCARQNYWKGCDKKCCGTCSDLGECKYACPKFAEQIKKIKADKREARKQEKLAKDAEEAPTISAIQEMWRRFGQARRNAHVSVEAFQRGIGVYYSKSDDEKFEKWERLEEKFSTHTALPYGYSCQHYDVERFVKAADLLGVSLDWLLLRTDNPTPCTETTTRETSEDFWPVAQNEDPPESGLYWCITGPLAGGGKLLWWNEEEKCWEHPGAKFKLTTQVISWMKCPDLPDWLAWNREGEMV